jgi:hypothetical protein
VEIKLESSRMRGSAVSDIQESVVYLIDTWILNSPSVAHGRCPPRAANTQKSGVRCNAPDTFVVLEELPSDNNLTGAITFPYTKKLIRTLGTRPMEGTTSDDEKWLQTI